MKLSATIGYGILPWAFASPLAIDHSVISDKPIASSIKGLKGYVNDKPKCNGQYYDPYQYTCFGDQLLCPWQDGYPQDRCGITDQCYLPFRYGCDNGKLTELPTIEGPFELIAINLRELAYVKVKACGNNFWLMDGDSCTYCPDLPKSLGACPPGKDTVFGAGGRSMDTMVPGGQYAWVNPAKNGAFEFSIPHSAWKPDGAIQDFLALQNGTFAINPGTKGWIACPSAVNEDPSENKWQIFAQLPNATFASNCAPVNLVTVPWQPDKGSNSTPAAWEYT